MYTSVYIHSAVFKFVKQYLLCEYNFRSTNAKLLFQTTMLNVLLLFGKSGFCERRSGVLMELWD